MHDSVRNYVTAWREKLSLKDLKTLEIGSLDVNGGVSDLFPNHTGTDFREGPGVDIVLNSWELSKLNGTFDLVLWLETMEHDLKFWLTIDQIRTVLNKGGILIVTTRGINFPFHPHPKDYYRFTKQSFAELFEGFKPLEITDDLQFPGVFGVYQKL